MQIGFEQTAYTVHEGDKSVTVCAVKAAGDIVTLLFFTADGLSAQVICIHISVHSGKLHVVRPARGEGRAGGVCKFI